MRVTPYDALQRDAWDTFVRTSKNGTFLFERAYMDYHADRFADASLMVRDTRGDVVALLPANARDGVVYSHQGLTYGGFVTGPAMTTPGLLELFTACLTHLRERGVQRLVYKTIPAIYHRLPAEEDRHALFRAGAALFRRDVLSVIDYRSVVPLQERRARNLRKAERGNLAVRETTDFETFWPILAGNLAERYGVAPVHTLDEIRLLAGRFPTRIRLFGAYDGNVMIAGVVVYVSDCVCHVQYPGTSAEGRQTGALDLLQHTLIERFRSETRYFDFGTSTEADGYRLNEGLIAFKEGFGARAVAHDFYELSVADGLEMIARG